MHADHNVDLIPLRHWVKYVNRGYGPALYGPAELRARMGEFQADKDFLADLGGESLAPQTFAVGDLRVTAGRVSHIPDSFAFRVAAASGDGPGLVYSGDCGVADDLLPLLQEGDTLLSEAAWGAGKSEVPIHMPVDSAGGGASELDRFLHEMSVPKTEPQPKLTVSSSSLPAETTVVLLDPRGR